MAFKAGVETNDPSAFSEAQKTSSKTSLTAENDVDGFKRQKGSMAKEKRVRTKTTGAIDMKVQKSFPGKRQTSEETWMSCKEKSETSFRKNSNEEEQQEGDRNDPGNKRRSLPVEKRTASTTEVQRTLDGRKRVLLYQKPSETYWKLVKEGHSVRNVKPKDGENIKRSEIPKLTQLAKLRAKNKISTTIKSAPLQQITVTEVTTAEPSSKHSGFLRKKSEQNRLDGKTLDTKTKKELKLEEKIKQALKENFNSLVPMYETELKKITDTWVNTVYCSLTMRANLVKLLYEAIPGVNRSQFHMEDETILQTMARVKSYTRSEAETLIHFIKLLIGNRNKAKDDYTHLLTRIEIAESYNNDWKALTSKIKDLDEESKLLQRGLPMLLQKKEDFEKAANEKIHQIESSINRREEDIKKLENQLCLLRQREQSFKGNVSLKVEDYKDIKEEVLKLKTIEKEFEELKAQYSSQNESYETKIKELESQLEERKKTLKKEKEVKNQLKALLNQLHTQQRHLYRTAGKEQVDYILGRTDHEKNNRSDQLWLLAIKLVMKGFLVQMKKLERDRNKMLLELNSNDLDNYNTLATAILQKDNFIKSIRQQMQVFKTASKYTTAKTSEVSVRECLKTGEHS